MQEPDDKDLVRRCLKGDQKAFETLLDRYQKPIYNVALRMVSSNDDAADLTQTVFIKAYENLRSYDERFKFFSWLYKIAVNSSLNFLEQKKRNDLLGDQDVSQGPVLEEQIEASERIEKLDDAILQLKPEYRVVLVLCYFERLSYSEMALALRCSIDQVRGRLHRARQAFRMAYRDGGDDIEV